MVKAASEFCRTSKKQTAKTSLSATLYVQPIRGEVCACEADEDIRDGLRTSRLSPLERDYLSTYHLSLKNAISIFLTTAFAELISWFHDSRRKRRLLAVQGRRGHATSCHASDLAFMPHEFAFLAFLFARRSRSMRK